MNNIFEKIQHLMDSEQITAISIRNNMVWVSKDEECFKETLIHLENDELQNIISFVTDVHETNSLNSAFITFLPHGFITQVELPTDSFTFPILTMYKTTF